MGETRTVLQVVEHPLNPRGRSQNVEQCEKCGAELEVGEWPFCPHGQGSAVASKQYPFVTSNFNGQPIEVTSAAHEKALCAEYGVCKRDDVAYLEKSYEGYDWRAKKQVYKEGNGVGLPGCWI